MFDKVIFNARIDFEKEAERMAERHHLIKCMEGNKTYYQSSTLGNLEGYYMQIKGNKIQIKCSLHKLWAKAQTGYLENSQMFTMTNAYSVMKDLFELWELPLSDEVRVTYYEIGLNIPTDEDPLLYISLAESMNSNGIKEFFNDANFEKNRQKTTEKSKNIKKVFKIYDKGFEARSKRRYCDENILRIETVYKRQNIGVSEWLSNSNINKMLHIFYRDWVNVCFTRRIHASKGIKASMMDKAERLLRLGRDEYLCQIRDEHQKGYLTDKQYRTVREFIQGWDKIKDMFRLVPTDAEKEYKDKLIRLFSEAKV